MFDMIDVIQMTKISKHYLLEYQTLLDTYEMQAPNVTSGFRVLDFSDDISDVDYTSDDWSMNESYSETSGEMTNSVQTNLLPNPPEYSVCAGSKPLSIIIRRCNTPTVACSSPVQENDQENPYVKGESLPSDQCDVTNSVTCPEEEQVCCRESDTDAICNTSESVNIVNTSTGENVLSEGKEENTICSKGITPSSSPSKEVIITVNDCDKNSEDKDMGCAKRSEEIFPILNEENSFTEVSLLPCLEEKNQNDRLSFFCTEENKVLDDVIQKVVDDLCPNGKEILSSSEYVSCSLVEENCSNNIERDKIIVPKQESHLRDELNPCINDVSSSSNNIIFHPQVDNVNLNFTEETAEDLEVSYLTNSFCHENSDVLPSKHSVIENCVTVQSTLCLNESLEIHPSELVDGWRQSNCSPLLFSSDDESSSITDEVNRGIEAALAPSPQYNAVLSEEKKRVGRLQELLMGAPPPPAVTMPLHSASDMLDALKDPAHWVISDTSATSCYSSQMPWYQEAASTPWPQVKCLQYPSIHYNHGSISEQFESLCQKLLARCVGTETASSVTVWSSFTLPVPRRERRTLTSRRSGTEAPTGLSPGRRLSHLARRHRTFSSAALLNDGARLHCTLPHVAPERRTILVEGRRKESRKQRSSQKKNLADRSRDAQAMKLNSSKRALFQSPTEEKKASVPSKFRPSSASAIRSKRALFVSDQTESQSKPPGTSNGESASASASRKRTRAESEEEMCERLPRRRLFSDTDTNAFPVTNKSSSRQSELSSTHKKKLLWAVAEALKKRSVGFSHPQFRACAAALASTCRGHVHEVLALRQGSTSDRLLQLALRFVDGAVAQHIKGHPPSEQTKCKEVG
ncbi:hypothetical protein R5R35_009533 [Gryllus longicercus]|uniref:Uncharacterized protein n=1 Tax=Gryllus longicercus TaxID=2509291 RepID=A0AAN9Z4J1_9ORTH